MLVKLARRETGPVGDLYTVPTVEVVPYRFSRFQGFVIFFGIIGGVGVVGI